MTRFIGLMSGTSLDGVDGVRVDLPDPAADAELVSARTHAAPRVEAFVHLDMPAALRAELLALNRPGDNELHRAALAGNALAGLYAQAVQALLVDGLAPGMVAAIGAHGQTVRHRPGEFDGLGYTLQLLNGALLAELTGMAVVCDLRSRDLAAGGQGAPLVCAFHARCFARPGEDVAVLNLGGIANLTLLRGDGGEGAVIGFDCGPANVLMDLWCQREQGLAFDADGQWAAGGEVDQAWLRQLLQSEPYFALTPPKSTGRDLFAADWLDARLAGRSPGTTAQDTMRTLLELSAQTATDALAMHLPGALHLHVCGGGACNRLMMQRLQALNPQRQVQSTAALGMPPDQVEALAFAWLAQAALTKQAGNVPDVTGAKGPRVLGAVYPAT